MEERMNCQAPCCWRPARWLIEPVRITRKHTEQHASRLISCGVHVHAIMEEALSAGASSFVIREVPRE